MNPSSRMAEMGRRRYSISLTSYRETGGPPILGVPLPGALLDWDHGGRTGVPQFGRDGAGLADAALDRARGRRGRFRGRGAGRRAAGALRGAAGQVCDYAQRAGAADLDFGALDQLQARLGWGGLGIPASRPRGRF